MNWLFLILGIVIGFVAYAIWLYYRRQQSLALADKVGKVIDKEAGKIK